MTKTTSTQEYTDTQATDEALLLLIRKLRRLHPAAFTDVMGKLPEGAREALNTADIRADRQRAADQRDGITRRYVLIDERIAAEVAGLNDADEIAFEDADAVAAEVAAETDA
jgi:hypothetical protein